MGISRLVIVLLPSPCGRGAGGEVKTEAPRERDPSLSFRISLRGAESGSAESDPNNCPENNVRFRDSRIRLVKSLHPSFIQTITVGSGVPPDHVLTGKAVSKHSWAIPPIGNCTLPRRFLFGCLDYTRLVTNWKSTICDRGYDISQLRFYDAIDRADTHTLG